MSIECTCGDVRLLKNGERFHFPGCPCPEAQIERLRAEIACMREEALLSDQSAKVDHYARVEEQLRHEASAASRRAEAVERQLKEALEEIAALKAASAGLSPPEIEQCLSVLSVSPGNVTPVDEIRAHLAKRDRELRQARLCIQELRGGTRETVHLMEVKNAALVEQHHKDLAYVRTQAVLCAYDTAFAIWGDAARAQKVADAILEVVSP